MYRTKVEIIDAVTAAELIGTTLINNADVGCSFPTDPIATYHSKGIYVYDIWKMIFCVVYIQIYKISKEAFYTILMSQYFLTAKDLFEKLNLQELEPYI